MEIKNMRAVYFSATGTTQKIVECVANILAEKLGAGYESYDFTLPESRKKTLRFAPGDIVVFGTPVYAGRVPNVLLKYLETIEGNDAWAIPIVLYGNRDYDDGLIELRDILQKHGLHTVAAAAFIGEHSFSDNLAAGRPDQADLLLAKEFADKISEKLEAVIEEGAEQKPMGPIPVKGVSMPYRGYYQPRDSGGNPVDIRKVKPVTNRNCNHCLICTEVCPMGSISRENVNELIGICIKCGACIKKCPAKAKSFEDPAFLHHKRELEEGLIRRAEPELFL